MGKQTAVDWLIEKYYKSEGNLSVDDLDQAQEMEKQQIIDACNFGIKLYINDPITAEDYYNETFVK